MGLWLGFTSGLSEIRKLNRIYKIVTKVVVNNYTSKKSVEFHISRDVVNKRVCVYVNSSRFKNRL